MRAFFPTEKDIAEDRKALKMLSVTKRGQKKTTPQRTRNCDDSIDGIDSDNEEYGKSVAKRECITEKEKKRRKKHSSTKTKKEMGESKKRKKHHSHHHHHHHSMKHRKSEIDDDIGCDDNDDKDESFTKRKSMKEDNNNSTHKYSLRHSSSSKHERVIKLDSSNEDSDDSETESSDNDDNSTLATRFEKTFSSPKLKRAKIRKVVVVREESDDSDSDIDPKDVSVGHDYAVRGSGKTIWVGRVTKAEKSGFNVQWFEELRAYPKHYALLPWYARVPPTSVVKELKMTCIPYSGMWKLETDLPAFKVYQK